MLVQDLDGVFVAALFFFYYFYIVKMGMHKAMDANTWDFFHFASCALRKRKTLAMQSLG